MKEKIILEINWNDPKEIMPKRYAPVAVRIESTGYDGSKEYELLIGFYNNEGEWVAINYNTPNAKIGGNVTGWALIFENDTSRSSPALTRFTYAYDNVDLEKLTDEDLETFGALCNNGYGDYLREKRNRESNNKKQ